MGIPLPALLMSVVAIGCAAVALVAFLPMYVASVDTTDAMGEELIGASTRGSTNDLRYNFEVAVSGVDIVDMVIDRSDGILAEEKVLPGFMALLRSLAPKGVNYISFATEREGDFFGLEVAADGTVFWRIRNATYRCRTEFRLPNGLSDTGNISLIPTGAVSCAYEPRLRSWYTSLNNSFVDVTAAYPYTSAAQLAMTFGRRVDYPNGTQLGVVTTDVSTASVSALLAAAAFGRTGHAFAVEVKTRTTLATSLKGVSLLTNYVSGAGSASSDVTPFEALNAAYAKVALSAAPQLVNSREALTEGSRRKSGGFWVSVRDMTETPSMHWRLIIVVPTADYFASVDERRNVTIGLTVGMVAAVILLAVLIQPLILVPLGLLRRQVTRAATLDIDLDDIYGADGEDEDEEEIEGNENEDNEHGTTTTGGNSSAATAVIFGGAAAGALVPANGQKKKTKKKRSNGGGGGGGGRSVITEIDHLQDRVDHLTNAIVSFTRYIPKEVVRDMLAAGRGVAELGMEPAHLCVLFSDIVHFTAICESVSPEDLSRLLGAYFQRCVRVLMRHKATVDKFIGDAIMAFWGAPAADPQAEAWACLAAIHMQSIIESHVQPVFAKYGQTVAARIGINSGTALVGNIGSADRISYTALGDTVNVAARLEGCNKLFNSAILISGSTREFISEKNFLLRSLGKIAVVGREAPLPVYEVHGVLSTAAPPSSNLPGGGGGNANSSGYFYYSSSNNSNSLPETPTAGRGGGGRAAAALQRIKGGVMVGDGGGGAPSLDVSGAFSDAEKHWASDGGGGGAAAFTPVGDTASVVIPSASLASSFGGAGGGTSQRKRHAWVTMAARGSNGETSTNKGGASISNSNKSSEALSERQQRLEASRRRNGAFATIEEAFTEVRRVQLHLSRLERSAVAAFNDGMAAYQKAGAGAGGGAAQSFFPSAFAPSPTHMAEALRLFCSCKALLESVPPYASSAGVVGAKKEGGRGKGAKPVVLRRPVYQPYAVAPTCDPQWSERASAILHRNVTALSSSAPHHHGSPSPPSAGLLLHHHHSGIGNNNLGNLPHVMCSSQHYQQHDETPNVLAFSLSGRLQPHLQQQQPTTAADSVMSFSGGVQSMQQPPAPALRHAPHPHQVPPPVSCRCGRSDEGGGKEANEKACVCSCAANRTSPQRRRSEDHLSTSAPTAAAVTATTLVPLPTMGSGCANSDGVLSFAAVPSTHMATESDLLPQPLLAAAVLSTSGDVAGSPNLPKSFVSAAAVVEVGNGANTDRPLAPSASKYRDEGSPLDPQHKAGVQQQHHAATPTGAAAASCLKSPEKDPLLPFPSSNSEGRPTFDNGRGGSSAVAAHTSPAATAANIRALHTSVICPIFLSKMISLCALGEWVAVVEQQHK